MNPTATLPDYAPVLVPALQRIQHQFGYLQTAALEQYSKASGIPLQRLQAVASFFPHFRLAPPSKVTVRVCRDMACQMAESRQTLEELQALAGEHIRIEGSSCLGRCDRAPAACVSTSDSDHEHVYLGRSTDFLKTVIHTYLEPATPIPTPDLDAGGPGPLSQIFIDPYTGTTPDYAGVRKAVSIRNHAIRAAMDLAANVRGFSPRQVEEFRQGAVGEIRENFSKDPVVLASVQCWRTGSDWAAGVDLGGWSESLFDELKAADLCGMGGAGIPSAQKLRDVRDAVRSARVRQSDDRAFIVVNGDESEPGTFKDRELLLRYPHLILEAVILAGLVTDATQGFIFIRHEYGEQIDACRNEIQRAEALGVCGNDAPLLGRSFPVSVFVSPGGYICGEQSALIEAMSDRRAEPRNMPPKLETNGLQDLPTIVSNVETFAWFPYIFLRGGKTYSSHGVNGWKGRRFFSVSGDVKRPGVYEVPIGLTVRDLLYAEQYCQGLLGNRPLKAFAPSGPSGGFLPAKLRAGTGLPRDHINNKAWIALASRRGIPPSAEEIDILDLELDLNLFRALSPTQALGAGLVVYAEGRDMAQQALCSLEFFRNESCGKCVPCRMGSQKLVSLATQLVEGRIGNGRWGSELLPLVEELGRAIELTSICGLGRSVPAPLRTAMAYFPEDIARHLTSAEPSASTPAQEDLPCR